MKIEHWASEIDDIVFKEGATPGVNNYHRNYIEPVNGRLCCVIEGGDVTECMTKYHEHMGFEPYEKPPSSWIVPGMIEPGDPARGIPEIRRIEHIYALGGGGQSFPSIRMKPGMSYPVEEALHIHIDEYGDEHDCFDEDFDEQNE